MTRILLTGASGFLGTHLRERLSAMPGVTLIAPARDELDLLKPDQVLQATKGVDCIVHAATVLQRGHVSPYRVLRDNTRMQEHLLEAARINQVKKIVTFGTILMYGKGTPPFIEEHLAVMPAAEKQQYTLSKAALLSGLAALHEEQGTSALFIILPNLYGEHDEFGPDGHFVPTAIRRIVEAKERNALDVQFSGPGLGDREFLYAGDAAQMVCSLLRVEGMQVINMGTGDLASPASLAAQVAEDVGYKGRIVFREGQTRSMSLDTTRLRAMISEIPHTPLSVGLRRTLQWYVQSQEVAPAAMQRWPHQIGVGAVQISALSKRYVNETLDANRLSYGQFHRRFEEGFARAHGCRHCVFTNSGTSSLQIALAALKERYGWKDGDEVLCPATTFVATSNIVIQNGMVPVFVDVDPETYNMDPRLMTQHISARTRCVIVVHLYGHPADMDPIMETCRTHGLRMIEDSAETMFATYKGRPVGSFGDIACFSTYAAHILVTGVGGLTTTNDDQLAIMLRSAMNHGRDSIYLSIDDDKGKTGQELRTLMERRFRFERMGYSFRCTEMEAALGCAQLEEAADNIAARQRNAAALTQGLRKWSRYLQLPTIRPECVHAFMMYTILIRPDAPFSREEFTIFLEERNIETRTMVSILDQPYYQQLFGDLEPLYPVARWIDHNGLYIGCHREIGEPELQHMLSAIDEFFAQRGLSAEAAVARVR